MMVLPVAAPIALATFDIRIHEIERDLSVGGLRDDDAGDDQGRGDTPHNEAISCHG